MNQVRDTQNYIARLEHENHSKDQAIDKAAKVIESLRNDLERTRNELSKCEQQLSKVVKPKPSNEREKQYLQQIDELTQQGNSLRASLNEVTEQYRVKERAFQNALNSLEQKEQLIETLQTRMERLNTENDLEKENAQREIDFVKRLTENFHRSEVRPMDLSAIVKRRTGHSPDNSFILADSSNILHNRARSRQSRKPTGKGKATDLSSICHDGETETPIQQMFAVKYINYLTNDFDWEQSLHCVTQTKKLEMQKLVEKAQKRDYMQDLRCQIEQWQMRCAELETRFHDATVKAETLSELLRQSQFQFEFLKRSKLSLVSGVVSCLKRIIEDTEVSSLEVEYLVSEVEGSTLPDVQHLGEFALEQFHELIHTMKNVLQTKLEEQILQQQSIQRRNFENQSLEGQVGLLKQQLGLYMESYRELLETILQQELTQLCPQNVQRLHRQARDYLAKVGALNTELDEKSDQLHIITEKLRIADLEMHEAQHQNEILREELIKEEQEYRQVALKLSEVKEELETLAQENLKLREDLLTTQQRPVNQNMVVESQIYKQLQLDFDQLTEDHKQTMNLLDNALLELEQLHVENEKMCERFEDLECNAPPTFKDGNQSDRIAQLTLLLEDQNMIIQQYQQQFSKRGGDRPEQDLEKLFMKLRRVIEQCIVSQFQFQALENESLDLQKPTKYAFDMFMDSLNQLLTITQSIIIQDISFIQVFEDQFDLNIGLKQQIRDLQQGKEGLEGFLKNMTLIKQEIIHGLLVQQSSIRYQESINNQSDLHMTMKVRSNRISTLSDYKPTLERPSFMSQQDDEALVKYTDNSNETSYRPRVGGKIQRTFKSIAHQYTSLLNQLSSQWVEQAGSCDKSLVVRLENIVQYCKDAANQRCTQLAKKSINCLVINCFLLITLVRQWKEGTRGIAEIFFEVSTNFSDIVQQQNTYRCDYANIRSNKEHLSKMQMKYELFQNRVEEIINNINTNSLAITVENHLKQLESSAQDVLRLCEQIQ